MSTLSPVDSLLDRIRSGSAPEAVRAAAARGALPLPRAALARLWIELSDDAGEAIRADARRSLEQLDAGAIAEIFSDPECAPELLTHFAPRAARDERLAEAVAFHPSVPADALTVLAERGNSAIIELVLTNQERLLRSPGLLDSLTRNPALRPDQRGRLLELLDRAANFAEPDTNATEPAPVASAESFDVAARLLEVDVGELFAASEILGGDEFERHESPEIRSVYRKILTLNTAQRAILAIKGGREERLILVRDTNKVVALSVLKNARLTEGEVEAIAGMRNVSTEVLRAVGSNREWIKNYGVIAAMVRNPLSPPGIVTNFVARLTNRDLKFLVGDKNVPELIRRMARKTIEIRTQQTKVSFKKKG